MGDSRSVGLGEGGDGFFEARAEFGRREDFGGGSPAQDPLLSLAEGAEAEAEFEGAAGEVAHLLALVPLAFADALGDGGREADDDTMVAGAAHDAEGVSEEFLRREIGRARERDLGDGDFVNARDGEGAEGGALEIEGNEIPEVFAVGQMVGAHAAGGRFGVAGFAVGEGDLVGAEDGGAEGVKNGEVGFADADIFEGDGAKFVGGREGDFVAEAAGKFFEGDFELMVKRGALILLEGALGDEEGKEFAFGHVDGGKGVYGVRVAVGEDLSVELYGEFEAVAHEGDVADDGFPGNLEGAYEVRTIDEGAATELVMDAQHTFEGRSGELGAGGGHGFGGEGGRRDE